MRKIYLLMSALFVTVFAGAQVDVTFQVDMSNETVSGNGVHVAGSFQSEAGATGDWQPGETQLTDPDMDGIYSVTVNIPEGRYEFKFINDNDWAGVESVPSFAQVDEGSGNDNRYVFVTAITDTLAPVQFSGTPTGMRFVKFKVNMENEDVTGARPSLSGSMIGWSEGGLEMFDPEGDMVYYNYLYLAEDSYEFKYRTDVSWGGTNESISGECGVDGSDNRALSVSSDTILMAYCFNSCTTCSPEPEKTDMEVTFQVDMNVAAVCEDIDSVSVAGSFQGWSAGEVIMEDGDNDGIYTYTTTLQTYEKYEFKYQIISNGVVKWEGRGNRSLEVNDTTIKDTTLALTCFDSEAACGDLPPAAANVTFRVDMTNETPADTIWIIGSFTDPQWQAGAIPLEYSGTGGLFTTTVEICPETFQWKFVNGDPNTVTNEEFNGISDTPECATPNGIGGFNRSTTRLEGDTTLPVYYFSTCDINNVSIFEPVANEFSVEAFPNPTSGLTRLEIMNREGEDLNLRIRDLSGKLVFEIASLEKDQVSLNLSELNKGLYLIEINSTSRAGYLKLMIE